MRRLTGCALAVLLAACTSSAPSPSSTPSPSSSSPAPSASPSPAGAQDWLEYGAGPARTAVSPDDAPLGRVRQTWRSPKLDGSVYAQPLIFDDGKGAHVVVATEHNSVYSLAAASGKIEWRAALGSPVRGGDLPCGNIDPSGITGTPLIAGGVVYVVAFLRAGPHHELFAIDATTGKTKWHRAIDPPGLSARVEQERGALAMLGGRVYVPFGGLWGDCGAYKGAVVSVPANGSGAMQSYVVPTRREAGIWNPAGPVSDGTNLWVTTGNSQSQGGFDHGNAVVKLSASLRALDYFAPRNWAALNAGDVDLGSFPPVIFPSGRIVAAGKGGTAYLLKAGALGHIGGSIASKHVCGGAFGASATAAGSPVYISCDDALVALRTANDTLSIAWSNGGGSGPPIIAAGAVWAIGYDGRLRAVRAPDGHVLFEADLGNPVTRFVVPSAAGGRLFAPARNTIVAFALR